MAAGRGGDAGASARKRLGEAQTDLARDQGECEGQIIEPLEILWNRISSTTATTTCCAPLGPAMMFYSVAPCPAPLPLLRDGQQ